MAASPPHNGAVRVLIADDHRLFAEALMTTLAADDRIDVIGIAHDGAEAVDLAQTLVPDIVLMDIAMPVMDGIEATRRIRELNPAIHILVLTASEPAAEREARSAGAAGFVTKDRSLSELKELFFEIASLMLAFGTPVVAEPKRP